MKITHSLEFQVGSKEEKLPYDTPDFPYIASQAELDSYREPFVPWHWHNAIELFYMESGELKYYTPHETLLHKTQLQSHSEKNIQLLHIFDPQLLAGVHGSLIEKKYISPLVNAPQIELIALSPRKPAQAAIIEMIRAAFSLPENEFGYELKIREALSRIWLELFPICAPLLQEKSQSKDISTDKIKGMMIYIHEHYAEKISIRELASAVYLSERECYRTFQNHLHMTPVDYIRSYRIQIACQLLVESQRSITEVGNACGMGNSSYFGKVFREATGYTPRQYRCKWQDKNII